ncbi:hypothetical protein J6590_045556 [Homalodisca vitripennis]|nr:hypothetical protein J6590_045556 [Homalodisca vitripennis]
MNRTSAEEIFCKQAERWEGGGWGDEVTHVLTAACHHGYAIHAFQGRIDGGRRGRKLTGEIEIVQLSSPICFERHLCHFYYLATFSSLPSFQSKFRCYTNKIYFAVTPKLTNMSRVTVMCQRSAPQVCPGPRHHRCVGGYGITGVRVHGTRSVRGHGTTSVRGYGTTSVRGHGTTGVRGHGTTGV